MSYELAQKYAEFEIPTELKNAHRSGMQLVGSLAFTKMMLFANENQITNDDIEWFTNRPPRTMDEETYEDMKMRTKLANALYKYRPYLYDYSVYEKQN